MICCLYYPNYPARAAALAGRVTGEVIVVGNEKVAAVTPGLAGAIAIGMPVGRARTLAPSATVVQRDIARERAVWDMIIEQVFACTPLITSRQGMLLCGLDDREGIGRIVLGQQVQCGIATTRTLAMMAALRSSAGKTMLVRADDTSRFLATWSIELLAHLDYSDEMVSRLKLFGLSTYASLMQLNRRHLHAQFGTEGLALHALMMTVNDRSQLPLHIPLPCIQIDQRFSDPQREPGILESAVDKAIQSCMEQLHSRTVGRLEVSLLEKSDRAYMTSSRILKNPTDKLSMLRNAARILLAELISPDWCYGIRVVCKSLHVPVAMQTTLFAAKPTTDDVAGVVLRRHPRGLLRVERMDADAYLPEHAATLVPYMNR